MRKLTLAAAAAVALLLAPPAARAQASAHAAALAVLASASEPLPLKLDSGGPGAEWAVVVNKGRADLRVAREDGSDCLLMRSDSASFGLQRKVQVDLDRRPFLAWRWKVDVLPEKGDFRYLKTNDQAAQIYVAFSPTRAIGYVWDSSAPAGSEGDNPSVPPFMKVKIIVLRSGGGGLGEWAEERRDLRADYERLFGEALPATRAVGLRLWINSQHTSSEAASAFADLRFE
jgi:hypothetical protein